MAARKRTNSSIRSYSCRSQLQRLIFLVTGCCFCIYAYVWRHYFALVLQPPSNSFKYEKHYKDTFKNADPHSLAKLRKKLVEPLPEWLADYVNWHAAVRTSSLQNTTRMLLVSIEEQHSGGLADRLRSLPFLLWEAVRTKRLFLMRWMNPCAVQEFLVPPLGGIDWTVPDDLLESSAVWYIYDEHNNVQLADNDAYKDYPLIKTWHSPWTFVGGMPLLAKELKVNSLRDSIFSHIYRVLITPSPPVQDLMDKTMQTLKLVSQEYNGIHLRARYPGTSIAFQKKSRFSRSVDADGLKWTPDAKNQVQKLVSHAIDCLETNNMTRTMPIYFASDTNEAVKLVTQQSENVVGMVTPLEKMHLNRNDKVGLIRTTPPSAFYPAVVDLWILSQAACLAVGAGGYGIFASILGETECLLLHTDNDFVGGNTQHCPQTNETQQELDCDGVGGL